MPVGSGQRQFGRNSGNSTRCFHRLELVTAHLEIIKIKLYINKLIDISEFWHEI